MPSRTKIPVTRRSRYPQLPPTRSPTSESNPRRSASEYDFVDNYHPTPSSDQRFDRIGRSVRSGSRSPSRRSRSNSKDYQYGIAQDSDLYKNGKYIQREGIARSPVSIQTPEMQIGQRRTSFKYAYEFGYFEILISLASIAIFYLDIGTDLYLTIQYFLSGNYMYGGVTLAITAAPSLITCFLGLHWYIIDYHTVNKDKDETPPEHKAVGRESVDGGIEKSTKYTQIEQTRNRWILRFTMTILQMGPVIRTSEYIYNGRKYSQAKNQHEKIYYYRQMLFDDVDACLIRLFESFLESAPQLMWQIYIWVTLKPNEDVILESIRALGLLSSWGSLGLSLMSYQKSLRLSKIEKCDMKRRQMLVYFLWRSCEIGNRILCLALFASAFHLYVFVPISIHWILASIWLMCQRTNFYVHNCLEKMFNVICGYVMIFCFINLREGYTRFRYILFYICFYLENSAMLAIWFRFTPDLGAWFHIAGFIVMLVLSVLHIMFQVFYYLCCHPSGNIQYCLAMDEDRTLCWESLCYDLDLPESCADMTVYVHKSPDVPPANNENQNYSYVTNSSAGSTQHTYV